MSGGMRVGLEGWREGLEGWREGLEGGVWLQA